MPTIKPLSLLGAGTGAPPPVRLSAFLICPDPILAAEIQRDCQKTPGVRFIRVFDSYPTGDRFCNLLHIDTPNTVVIDVSDEKVATGLVGLLRSEAPGVQIVAAHRLCDSAVLRSVMRLRITEFLCPPVSSEDAQDTFARVQGRLSSTPGVIASSGQIYSFLPARPGVGTTTTALNTALTVARIGKDRVFLGDFDLGCGLLRFMLKLQNSFSVLDAVERVLELDEHVWPQITHHVGLLDAVHAGTPKVNARLSCESVRQLCSFLRRKYTFAFADLSGNLEEYSVEIMKASKQVFIVAMPELTALHQAREKVRLLEELGLADRTSIILNRTSRRSEFDTKDVEKLVGARVQISLPEDAGTVHTALTAGGGVAANSQLGKQYEAFARRMMSLEIPVTEKKRRFIEHFYTAPRSYSLEQA